LKEYHEANINKVNLGFEEQKFAVND